MLKEFNSHFPYLTTRTIEENLGEALQCIPFVKCNRSVTKKNMPLSTVQSLLLFLFFFFVNVTKNVNEFPSVNPLTPTIPVLRITSDRITY